MHNLQALYFAGMRNFQSCLAIFHLLNTNLPARLPSLLRIKTRFCSKNNSAESSIRQHHRSSTKTWIYVYHVSLSSTLQIIHSFLSYFQIKLIITKSESKFRFRSHMIGTTKLSMKPGAQGPRFDEFLLFLSTIHSHWIRWSDVRNLFVNVFMWPDIWYHMSKKGQWFPHILSIYKNCAGDACKIIESSRQIQSRKLSLTMARHPISLMQLFFM